MTTRPSIIELSMAAREKVAQILCQTPHKPHFRIQIKGGGCSGFEYVFGIDDIKVVTGGWPIPIVADRAFTLYGDGSQTRSFCYVDDLIRGMILLMESDYKLPINIGNPCEFSIIELATIVKNLINPNLEFIYKKLPNDDPRQRKPSIEKAMQILNWEPHIQLQEGLIKTINWFKSNI